MNFYDCHRGPGTTKPACGACVTCLHRVIEQKDQRIQRLEEVVKAVAVIAPRIIEAIPEYAYEIGLVAKAKEAKP